jgi:hypothetical protein
VVSTYPSEKYEFVSWNDEIPNIWTNKIHVPVTTNQIQFDEFPSYQPPFGLGNSKPALFDYID